MLNNEAREAALYFTKFEYQHQAFQHVFHRVDIYKHFNLYLLTVPEMIKAMKLSVVETNGLSNIVLKQDTSLWIISISISNYVSSISMGAFSFEVSLRSLGNY